VDLRSSLHVHDNPLAIAAAVSDFTIPPPSAIKFHTGAVFLPHLAKPKTSSAPAQFFFGFNRRHARANACFIESNHLETNADVAAPAFFSNRGDNAYTKQNHHRLIIQQPKIPMKQCIDLVHELSFWPLPQTECAFCAHRKCRRCREVSFSIAACCQCRMRAIERLKYLRARIDETDTQEG